MTGVLYGLARFCVRHRFAVLAVWLVVTVALVAVSHRLGDNTNDNLTLPGTNSQQATDALSKSFPDQANGSSPIVLHVTSGKLTDSKYSQRGQPGRGRRGQGAVRGLGGQPAHLAGRLGAEQGPGDGLPVGDRCRSARGRCPSTTLRRSSTRRPSPPRRPGSRWRPAASSARRCPSRRPSPAS